MTQHADILDAPEPVGRSLAASVLFHVAVAAAVLGSNVMTQRTVERWGDPKGGGIGSVAVTPVAKIPLPARRAPVNPLANDTESMVPAAPPKAKPLAHEEEPDEGIAIRSRTAKKRVAERAATERALRAEAPRENQVYSRSGQALSTPMVGLQGGGGVGIGNNSPFGNRFGYYADLLRRKVGSAWQTAGLPMSGGQAIVQMTIRRDGSVPQGSVRIVQTSGNAAVDRSAQRAIYDASPMPPLPTGFERSEAVIEFVFELRR